MTDDGKQIHYSVNTCYICSDIKPMIMYMCVLAHEMYGIDQAGASAITASFPGAQHILCHWHIQRYHKFFVLSTVHNACTIQIVFIH